MKILGLAWQSLRNRAATALLTLFVISISVALLLGVERVQQSAKTSFQSTISGTDLLMGARTGGVQLLLYSVFRIGNATNNFSWDSLEEIRKHPDVEWVIPISLGDSHRGYRVMGTDSGYFSHFRYGRKKELHFEAGRPFSDLYDAVIGSEVARVLGYGMGTEIVLSHGVGEVSFQDHKDKPFRIAGILQRTGTPVDRTVHVSVEAITAIHMDWQQGAPPRKDQAVSAQETRAQELSPSDVTAALIGLKSKIKIFEVQRFINDYRGEPLMAVLPGVTFQQLWETVGVAETALKVISAFVVLTALLGMLTSILTSLNERRREMAILRSVGVKPRTVFGLFLGESVLLSFCGILVGWVLLYLLLFSVSAWLESEYGLFLPLGGPSLRELLLVCSVLLGGVGVGCIPAWRAYRRSLIDGLTVRI